MVEGKISLRKVVMEDKEFLYRVYADSHRDELSLTEWDETRKEAFLRLQFYAQDRFYHDQFPGTDFLVILVNGTPVGRLYLERHPEEIKIIDIALLLRFRKQGIGVRVLQEVMEEARTKGQSVRIHVEQSNPALSTFKGLGFTVIGENGVYYLMGWRHGQSGS